MEKHVFRGKAEVKKVMTHQTMSHFYTIQANESVLIKTEILSNNTSNLDAYHT